jgi:hypothetical protein
VPVATQDDIEQLQALAGPYLYADIRGSLLSGEVTLYGIVKTPGHVAEAVTPAAQVRLALLQSAEALIAALEPAGWQLTGRVKLSFSSDVRGPTLFMDGTVAVPNQQETAVLEVDLHLIRAALAQP